MKKIIYIFCILLLSLNLISCGSKSDDKENAASENKTFEEKESTDVVKSEAEELRVYTFTANDNYVKAKWVYGPGQNSE